MVDECHYKLGEFKLLERLKWLSSMKTYNDAIISEFGTLTP